ncbi:hypothetical protein [Pseudoduganella namucuonensis]|uniref:Uncharacterized protein n=1 Tax=Pseudoduganella namucuonensis TaxID=1035707 RepID=A0A1I7LY77_9BURK|nr:hypothetical protein [Pseudoduganella namucuonensis]SFV14628.1 hypothetical protein SAMN05216552_104313 [Pseudoduganella namucuonensis]
MPRLFKRIPGQSLRIGVSAHAVSLLRVSRWGGDKVAVLAERAYSTEDAAAHQEHHAIGVALRELLAGQDVAHWPVCVVLADELARVWQVVPPQQAARLADLEAAAALRFFGLYGEAPAAWTISADWDTRAPFFAAAIPRALLATLEKVAEESHLALVEVRPHFVTAWNRWRDAVKPGAWFGQLHDGMLTLAIVDGKRLHSVRALAAPEGAGRAADHAWLAQTLRREALLAGLPMPELLQLCGQVPATLTAATAAAGAGRAAPEVAVQALGAPPPGEEKWSLASVLAWGGCAA